MKNLKKYIGLAVIGIALSLGVFVTSSNAQYRHHSRFSFNISIGRPSYYPVYRSRYYRRPVVTYYEPRSVYYYPNYDYYDPYSGYVMTRRYYRY